jgi:hypothetical protein
MVQITGPNQRTNNNNNNLKKQPPAEEDLSCSNRNQNEMCKK